MTRQSRGMERNSDSAKESSKEGVSEVPKKRTRSASQFLKYPGEELPGERLPKQKSKKSKLSEKQKLDSNDKSKNLVKVQEGSKATKSGARRRIIFRDDGGENELDLDLGSNNNAVIVEETGFAANDKLKLHAKVNDVQAKLDKGNQGKGNAMKPGSKDSLDSETNNDLLTE